MRFAVVVILSFVLRLAIYGLSRVPTMTHDLALEIVTTSVLAVLIVDSATGSTK